MNKISLTCCAVLLVLLAGGLRFYHLGTWSFGNDEIHTFDEVETMDAAPGDHLAFHDEYRNRLFFEGDWEKSQIHKMPKLLPVAYSLLRLDYQLFGKDEFGARVIPALLGSLTVGIVFLLASPLIGFTGSLILATSLVFFPDHLYHSQFNRFFCSSFFFVSIVFLLAAHVATRRSVAAAWALGPTSILMVLCNSMTGVLWGLILGALVADYLLSRRTEGEKFPRAIFFLLTLWSVILLGIAWFHILPIVQHWNSALLSSKSTAAHSMASLVARLGFPIALFSGLGAFSLLLRIREKGNAFWLFLVVMLPLTIVFLTQQIVYLTWYTILFVFPFFVVASRFVDRVTQLWGRSDFPFGRFNPAFAAFFGMILVSLVNFPNVVSYYVDGNRTDIKTACRYVQDRMQPKDIVMTTCAPETEWYMPGRRCRFPINVKIKPLFSDVVNENPGRIWLIVHTIRDDWMKELRDYVDRNSVFQKRFRKRRFDHMELGLDVLLMDGSREKCPPIIQTTKSQTK